MRVYFEYNTDLFDRSVDQAADGSLPAAARWRGRGRPSHAGRRVGDARGRRSSRTARSAARPRAARRRRRERARLGCRAGAARTDRRGRAHRRARHQLRRARPARATGWRINCWRRACATSRWSASTWSAPSTWSWRCWRCSKPAPRTCRWIRRFPRDRIQFMMADAALESRAHALGAAGRACRPSAARVMALDALAGEIDAPSGRGASQHHDATLARLRDLHLRFDRTAQGRADRARRGRQLPAIDARRARHRRQRSLGVGDDAVVRHRRPRDLRPAVGRRHRGLGPSRHGPRWAAPRRTARRRRRDDPAGHAGHLAAAAGIGLDRCTGTARPEDAVRRRSPAARARRAPARRARRVVEHVRPDRNDDLVDRGTRA